MRVTVLGCGGSNGVPTIGNRWGACDPANPRNRRLRPSVLVEDQGVAMLIDTTPDLREQLLTNQISRVDAVLYTHAHADHCHGIDEMRELNRLMGRPIAVHARADAMADLNQRFGYCFQPITNTEHPFYKPQLLPREITGPFTVGPVTVIPFEQDHGWVPTLGFRIGGFAYSTDVLRLDEPAFAVLAGIDTWIVDCVREEPHPVHSHLAQTLDWIARVRPRQAWLTHMSNAMDYDTIRAKLPPGVAPAYDGLVVTVGEAQGA